MMKYLNRVFLSILVTLFLSACGDENAPKDYIKIAGGGIAFNYRYSQASMIVIAQQIYPFPDGSTVEALFDVPGTATRQSVTLPSMEGKLTYKLQSDPLTHITKGGQYTVTIRLSIKPARNWIKKTACSYQTKINQPCQANLWSRALNSSRIWRIFDVTAQRGDCTMVECSKCNGQILHLINLSVAQSSHGKTNLLFSLINNRELHHEIANRNSYIIFGRCFGFWPFHSPSQRRRHHVACSAHQH